MQLEGLQEQLDAWGTQEPTPKALSDVEWTKLPAPLALQTSMALAVPNAEDREALDCALHCILSAFWSKASKQWSHRIATARDNQSATSKFKMLIRNAEKRQKRNTGAELDYCFRGEWLHVPIGLQKIPLKYPQVMMDRLLQLGYTLEGEPPRCDDVQGYVWLSLESLSLNGYMHLSKRHPQPTVLQNLVIFFSVAT